MSSSSQNQANKRINQGDSSSGVSQSKMRRVSNINEGDLSPNAKEYIDQKLEELGQQMQNFFEKQMKECFAHQMLGVVKHFKILNNQTVDSIKRNLEESIASVEESIATVRNDFDEKLAEAVETLQSSIEPRVVSNADNEEVFRINTKSKNLRVPMLSVSSNY